MGNSLHGVCMWEFVAGGGSLLQVNEGATPCMVSACRGCQQHMLR